MVTPTPAFLYFFVFWKLHLGKRSPWVISLYFLHFLFMLAPGFLMEYRQKNLYLIYIFFEDYPWWTVAIILGSRTGIRWFPTKAEGRYLGWSVCWRGQQIWGTRRTQDGSKRDSLPLYLLLESAWSRYRGVRIMSFNM